MELDFCSAVSNQHIIVCRIFVGSVARAKLTEEEIRQVETAYAEEDRTWQSITNGRGLCAMGKFKLKGDPEKIRAAARSTKDSTQSSSLKRKEVESSILKNSNQLKKSKNSQTVLRIESNEQSVPTATNVAPLVGKDKDEVGAAEDAIASVSPPIKMAQFLDEVTQALSWSAMEKVRSGDPDIKQNFRLCFNQTAKVNCLSDVTFDLLVGFSN